MFLLKSVYKENNIKTLSWRPLYVKIKVFLSAFAISTINTF